jgi:hypothetical protein
MCNNRCHMRLGSPQKSVLLCESETTINNIVMLLICFVQEPMPERSPPRRQISTRVEELSVYISQKRHSSTRVEECMLGPWISSMRVEICTCGLPHAWKYEPVLFSMRVDFFKTPRVFFHARGNLHL